MKKSFRRKYGADPIMVRAPVYTHLLGEQSGYDNGIALSVAIDSYIYLSVSKRQDWVLEVTNEEDVFITGLFDPGRSSLQWQACVEGVIGVFLRKGAELTGLNLMITSDIPQVSMACFSAALCCSLVLALDALFDLGYARTDLARIAKEAIQFYEPIDFYLMDHYTSLLAKKGHAIKMDLLTGEYSYVPVHLIGMELLLLDVGLAMDESGMDGLKAREECLEALRLVRIENPEVRSLREVNLNDLYRHVIAESPAAFKRAKYMMMENERVTKAAWYLKNKAFNAFGESLYSGHAAIQELAKATPKEIDVAANLIRHSGIIMGFRSVQNRAFIILVRKGYQEWLKRTTAKYHEITGRTLKSYRVTTVGGAEVLDELSSDYVKMGGKSDTK